MTARGWHGKRVSEMTDREIQEMAGAAPGVVKIRLSGHPADVAAVQDLFAGLAHVLRGGPAGIEVLDRSAPYPNRRDPGVRVYVTVRVLREG